VDCERGSPVTAVAWNPQHLLLSVAAEEVSLNGRMM